MIDLRKKTEILYIYKEPFTGSILNTMSNGFVHYTGEPQTRKYTDENGSLVSETSYLNPLNFEQYNELKGGGLKIATDAEMDILLNNHHNSLIQDFKEITEDSFMDCLECMPPKRWHKHKDAEIFFICEAYTGNLHDCCIAIKGKYFKALRPVNEPSESLHEAVTKALNNCEKTEKVFYTITEEKYNSTHRDYKGVYSSDNIHGTNFDGRRTLMTWIKGEGGGTCLLIEGESLKIVKTEAENINPAN